MRINFAELQEEETPHNKNIQLNNQLLHLWKQQQSQHNFNPTTEDNTSVNFAVAYPYEVSRSLSPQGLNKQFQYMKAKQVLPTSTLNYIKCALHKDIDQHLQIKESPERNNYSYYFDNSIKISKSRSRSQSEKKAKLQLFPVQSTPNKKSFKNLQNIGFRSSQRAQQKAAKMKRVINEVLAKRKQKQTEELTLKPVLNYTMNSKTSKKVQQKRTQYFQKANISVFQSLYKDAARNQAKRKIEKIKGELQTHNHIKKKQSRIQVATTFEERLRRSLETSAERRNHAQNRQDTDPSTGKKMFVPDTHLSKLTYYSHFKSSFSISQFPEEQLLVRPQQYGQQSSKLNKSYEQLTTTKNYSLTEITQMNRKCQGKPQMVPTIPGKRQEKLSQLYADLIWKQGKFNGDQLTSEEFKILGKFLHDLNEFQYSETVSRQVFIALFKDFLGKTNLFDKNILTRRLKKLPPQQTSRTDLNSSLEIPRPKQSAVQAPDHHHKFFYV